MSQVIQRRITLFGTEEERQAFSLNASDPSQVTGYRYSWVTPDGDEYESVGTSWVQSVRRGASRQFPLYASGSLQADNMHTRVHNGLGFRAGVILASVANNVSLDLVWTTAASDYPHIVWHPTLNGSANFELYEGATFTGGTTMTAVNFKRTSTREYAGTLKHSPTVTGTGTLIWSVHLAGGSGPHAAGGSASGFDEEWILKAETTYLARLTNKSGSAQIAGISPAWYIAPLLADS